MFLLDLKEVLCRYDPAGQRVTAHALSSYYNQHTLGAGSGFRGRVPSLLLEELKVDFENRFEETYVCTLIETDLMLP